MAIIADKNIDMEIKAFRASIDQGFAGIIPEKTEGNSAENLSGARSA